MFGTIRKHSQALWIPIIIVIVISFVVYFTPGFDPLDNSGRGQSETDNELKYARQQVLLEQAMSARARALSQLQYMPPESRNQLMQYIPGMINQALNEGLALLKEFMVTNTRVDTLNLFADLSDSGPFLDKQSIPLPIVLPAFITSELKTAFEIGFLIFLPFLVIDMVIASILMSLGMMMLSPMLISLPFKLLLFVLVDGWAMTIGSLSATFLVS